MGNYGGVQPKSKKSPTSNRPYDTEKRGIHTPVNTGKFAPKPSPEKPSGPTAE